MSGLPPPQRRALLTRLLTPPAGTRFDTGVATSFSLDPLALLGLPLSLAWLAGGDPDTEDPLALWTALSRVGERLTVFCDAQRIRVPDRDHPLFTRLEGMIRPARAPRGGAFHAKLWALRFVGEDGPVRLRLIVGSRNLSFDASWDLVLALEGAVGEEPRDENAPLVRFVAELPALALHRLPQARREHVDRLADDLHRAEWELPTGFDRLDFHAFDRTPELPPGGRIAVVSPFLSGSALAHLASGREAVALISRPEALAEIEQTGAFARVQVLNPLAEAEDGEEGPPQGLHAKLYLQEKGRRLTALIGSANATDNAWGVRGGPRNVEFGVALSGPTGRAGEMDDWLGDAGFGALVQDYTATGVEPEDAATCERRQRLEALRRELTLSGIRVAARKRRDGWHLALQPGRFQPWPAQVGLAAWPLTLPESHARPADGLASGQPVDLGTMMPEALTGLVAFRLTEADETLAFALNLPATGIPEETREAALLARLVDKREKFYELVRMVLAEEGVASQGGGGMRHRTGTEAAAGWEESLFEAMVRMAARQPERLRELRVIVERLRPSVHLLPDEFMRLWPAFETVTGK